MLIARSCDDVSGSRIGKRLKPARANFWDVALHESAAVSINVGH